MRSAQRLDQASRKSIFRQGRFESVFTFKLFALLRGQISFQKNFARIILLPYDSDSLQKTEERDQSRASSLHAMATYHGEGAGGRLLFHRRRELLESPRKVESFVCKKRFEF
jgi:hypothetical protein